jgi:2,4'-dihydroxyacetophenone dioxygenase
MNLNIPVSPYVRPELFDPDVMVEDDKWYALGQMGKVRPLLFDVTNGGWISILKAVGQGTIQRHRHATTVTAWTMDGAWGYREHDWIARAGSFAYEPAGHIHTLYIDPAVGHMTALFHVHGPLVYLDDKGNAVDYDDVFLRLDRYAKHCREVGLGEDYLRSLIR